MIPKTPQETGKRPANFLYGTEYTREDINLALQSANPWGVVPSRDEDGHGTFLAGVAAGNENQENEFSGIAPLADLCVVKCKAAKESLKRYYRLNTEAVCFMENDVMLGIRYLADKAVEANEPMVVLLGVGCNLGSHTRGGALGEVLQNFGDFRGFLVTTAGGNEANTSHHFKSPVLNSGEELEVELRVGDRRSGFTMELWGDAPNLYSVALTSPGGEYSGKTEARVGEQREIRFMAEDTVVNVEYLILSSDSGFECIRMRFQNPQEGVWRIRVFNETNFMGDFNIWLPMENFISNTTYFLRPDPDDTMCEPSNNGQLISASYYNAENRSVVVDSSRGFVRGQSVKPNFAAPGQNIFGPLPRLGNVYPATEEERKTTARYGYRSGSSMGAAVTAGCTALLAQWGLVDRNDPTMDTVVVQKYFIRGADRTGRNVPNVEWGWGTLDINGVFQGLRPGR